MTRENETRAGSELIGQLDAEHSYTSCSDDDLCNAGYNLCRRCTDLKLADYDRVKKELDDLVQELIDSGER